MLQLVTDQTRLMTTRMGVQNTVIYDPARIFERYGLRPDQMIDFKALKGDSTDNIPGVPGVGEKTAAKLIGDYATLDGLYDHIDDVVPARLREPLLAARDQVLMGRELMRIVRDLPVKLDLEAARLGDYDRETVIRLFREFEFRSLIERLPPLKGERAEDTAAAIRDSVASGGDPMRAAQVPGSGPRGSAGWGSGEGLSRGRGPVTGEGSGLQLALDFSSVDAAAGPAVDRSLGRHSQGDAARRPGRGAGRGRPCASPWPRRSKIPVDRSRSSRVRGSSASSHGSAAQSAVGIALLADDPRPRKGTPLALAVAGLDGRVVAVEGPADAGRLRALVERLELPIIGHEVKPLLVARFADAPDGQPTPVAFDTQIAAYILNASLRSQSIADVVAEQLDLILPPAKDLPAFARAGLEALSALAARGPLELALEREGLDRLYPRDRAAAHSGPGPDGGDRRRPRPRRAPLAWPTSSRSRSAGSRPRSTPASATSSTWAARSSSSRSCSSSSTCPRAARRRPATRPTPPSSRTSGQPIRWWPACSTGGPTRSSDRRTSKPCRR